MLPVVKGGRLVVLTGAGISKESGLSTFRDPDGIWAQYDMEEVATPEAFRRNPALVQGFYNARRRGLLAEEIRPNPAHEAIAKLEASWPGDFLLVTQNIDDLHERAGSREVLHMHGELLKVRCSRSGSIHAWTRDVLPEDECPCCGEKGTLRPHVVWFGEIPMGLDRIARALGRCDLFVAIGTSGQVYPAAGFVEEAKWRGGARAVILNLEPTDHSPIFDERIFGPASQTVPEFVERLLAAGGAGARA